MTESFEDAIKALRHIARGNGNVLRIADRIVAAHERETKVEGVCGPITGELRGAWMGQEADTWMFDKERFTQLCDAIDSVHATLEYEYDELRMKFVNANRHAQHVERENESLKAELNRALREQDRDGWMELPKDADGVPIRVGDTVEYVDDTLAPRNVTSINLAGDGWWVYINGFGRRPDKYRHVTHDTWERILADALGCEPYEVEGDDDLMALVARCKKLAGDAE